MEKAKIDFSNFKSFFPENSDFISDIVQLRKNLYNVSEDWQTQQPVKLNISDFSLINGINRYCIINEGVNFECLYLPHSTKKLFVSLTGGGRAGKKYPMFLRWKYKNLLNGHYLAIDDPMAINEKTDKVLWYYGTKEKAYLKLLLPIVEKFMKNIGIAAEDVVFFGSSGGGTASIYLANLLEGSTAIAMNPQYDLSAWSKAVSDHFLRTLHIDLTDDDIHNRNQLNITSSKSIFFLLENFASRPDQSQFTSFAHRIGIPVKYGITRHGNIISWIHHSTGPSNHSANPENYSLYFLISLLPSIREGADLRDIAPFSYLLNELLDQKK